MSAADLRASVSRRELDRLFQDFQDFDSVLLAVSGGPDSTALMWLAARWRENKKNSTKLAVATVDHRLRKESKAEADAVAKLAKKLKLKHHLLIWRGAKPKQGLPKAAREARYARLISLAKKLGAQAIATAHTRDDQAETMLHRIGRGSGVAGLKGIRGKSERDGIAILRPLLGEPKARLEAMLRHEKIPFAVDPTNTDIKFLRPRLRALAPALAQEGIDSARLSLLAKRIARAEAAIDTIVDETLRRASLASDDAEVQYDAPTLFGSPEEVGLRLVGGAINRLGHEGPAELAKLEALYAALSEAWRERASLRRTLAGALVDLSGNRLKIAPAPARKSLKRRARST